MSYKTDYMLVTGWNAYYVFSLHLYSNHGCGVGVPQSPAFGLASEWESLFWRRLRLGALSVSAGLLCNFVAVYLTFVPLMLQLKLCLCTILHLLLEEFKNFSQVILKYTIIISQSRSRSHTKKQELLISDSNSSSFTPPLNFPTHVPVNNREARGCLV